jgi:hypothetical protein
MSTVKKRNNGELTNGAAPAGDEFDFDPWIVNGEERDAVDRCLFRLT